MEKVLLHEQHHKGEQSLEYTALYQIKSPFTGRQVKLRLELKRDAYEFQSYGIVKIFSKESGCWNFLANIPWSHLAILKDSVYANQVTLNPKMLDLDVEELLKQAELILE